LAAAVNEWKEEAPRCVGGAIARCVGTFTVLDVEAVALGRS